ncbi:hypothetical protein AYO40_02850 [Planctomycetaceae bacterium SCGC AG-212-D15]|nr:hypothetical protein AYO40_02850 [Planctomycetaceae bacterium SCGC AG-212-D15]
MTLLTPLVFPGGRALAAWWRQLASYHPGALWIAHLFCHHVELLARVEQPFEPDRLALAVLHGLGQNPAPIELLAQQLGLHAQFLRRALEALRQEGLVEARDSGQWQLTESGQAGYARGSFTRTVLERRSFALLDRGAAAPDFLPLGAEEGETWLPEPGGRFNGDVVKECIRRSIAWKEHCGFPRDVSGIVPPAETSTVPEWRRVPIDRPRYQRAVLILTTTAGPSRILGFRYRPDGWTLDASRPILSIAADCLADCATPPTDEGWRRAWSEWCQAHGLTLNQAEACQVHLAGHRLHVVASEDVVQPIQAILSAQGDVWLLAGEGPIRQAALLDVGSSSA